MSERLTSVRNIPEDVKTALVEDATAAGLGVSTRATQLLAQRLELDYEPSQRRPPNRAGVTDQIQLRLPDSLATALWSTARVWSLTQSQAAIRIWAEHFGIPYRPVRRRAS